MHHLERHLGDWAGTNAFRLMPDDAPRDAPLRATLSAAADGALTQLAYTWSHPDDGPQEGLLVLGRGSAEDEVVAFWGDSWHQQPEPRVLEGVLDGPVATVGYDYGGGWRWRIAVDAGDPEAVTFAMHNVVPAAAASESLAAGPYAAMHAVLRRA